MPGNQKLQVRFIISEAEKSNAVFRPDNQNLSHVWRETGRSEVGASLFFTIRHGSKSPRNSVTNLPGNAFTVSDLARPSGFSTATARKISADQNRHGTDAITTRYSAGHCKIDLYPDPGISIFPCRFLGNPDLTHLRHPQAHSEYVLPGQRTVPSPLVSRQPGIAIGSDRKGFIPEP